jgi:phosphoglucosamine mutase
VQFGTDGVRGVANTELTAAFALDLGRAAGRVLGTERAVVGGDSRVSTPMLEAAFVAGLASEGVVVHRLGLVPTPTVAFHAARLDAMGAVISASHNPYHDNGIKLFARGGVKLADSVERELEAAVVDLPRPAGDIGRVVDASAGPAHAALIDGYRDHLMSVIGGHSLRGVRVVIDAANGAASALAGPVVEHAGADVIVINDQPDGYNINRGCGATDVTELADVVRTRGAQIGLGLDGDADRLIAVDEHGQVVDGDHLIAICALDLRARGELRHDTVVVTVMTNLGFRLAMRDAGIHVVETPVGDRYVLEALRAGSYSLGGEQSGHVIFNDHATTGDGLLTGLVLLDVLRRRQRPLSELAADAMSQLPQVLVNVAVGRRMPDVADVLAPEIAAASSRLGETGRVLVRPSGTEPLVRVMVEAATAEVAHETAHELARVVEQRFGADGPV